MAHRRGVESFVAALLATVVLGAIVLVGGAAYAYHRLDVLATSSGEASRDVQRVRTLAANARELLMVADVLSLESSGVYVVVDRLLERCDADFVALGGHGVFATSREFIETHDRFHRLERTVLDFAVVDDRESVGAVQTDYEAASVAFAEQLVRLEDRADTITTTRRMEFAGRRSTTNAIVASLIALFGGLAVIAYRRTATRLVRPIQRLAEAARRCTEDHAAFSFSAEGPREVHELGGTLQVLIGELEGLVAGRTAELTGKQRELQSTVARLERTHEQLDASRERELAAQRRVHQDERLRALGSMAAGVAHDLNNMLTPIRGYADLLIDSDRSRHDDARLVRYLSLIRTAADDAALVIRRLGHFYRPRDPGDSMGEVDLNEIVRAAVELTAFSWRDEAQATGATIVVEEELGDPPSVWGKAAELREVLTNLVLNATAALPHGGTITLRTGRDGGQAVVVVVDTGIGMSREVVERCIEPFFSTKGDHGSGLGLSVSHGVIRRHGGQLIVESALDEGTSVTVLLPAAATRPSPGPTEAPAPAPAPATAPMNTLKILVVDDADLVRDVIAECLAMDGHDVDSANSGFAALELFERGRYDVVITDRAMPGMSGDELALAMRGAAPEQRILLLTGFGDMMEAVGDAPSAVDRVLSKPIAPSDLSAVIADVMRRPGGTRATPTWKSGHSQLIS